MGIPLLILDNTCLQTKTPRVSCQHWSSLPGNHRTPPYTLRITVPMIRRRYQCYIGSKPPPRLQWQGFRLVQETLLLNGIGNDPVLSSVLGTRPPNRWDHGWRRAKIISKFFVYLTSKVGFLECACSTVTFSDSTGREFKWKQRMVNTYACFESFFGYIQAGLCGRWWWSVTSHCQIHSLPRNTSFEASSKTETRLIHAGQTWYFRSTRRGNSGVHHYLALDLGTQADGKANHSELGSVFSRSCAVCANDSM